MAIPPMVGVPALAHVRGGPVLPDVLAELTLAEVTDEERGEEDGDPQRDASRDEQTEHVPSALRIATGSRLGRRRQRRRRRVAPVGRSRCAGPIRTRRQRPARLDGVVEGQALPGDLLVGLVSLPRDDHDVPGPAASSARRMAALPVGLDHDARIGAPTGDAGQHLLDDGAAGPRRAGCPMSGTARSLRRAAASPITAAWPGPGRRRSRRR